MSQDFASLLRSLRRQGEMTQEALAEASGLSPEGISALERGQRRRPHPRTVDLLVEGLELDRETASAFRAAARDTKPLSTDSATEEITRERVPERPHQLLAPPAAFVGRDEVVHQLVQDFSDPGQRTTPAAAAITGMGGVGKSGLALLVAHRLAEHYPDGQIYLDLHGHDSPMSTGDALSFVLASLGVRDLAILGDADLGSAYLRSSTSGTRLLFVLDNAADWKQIEPLLPASPGNAVIITARQSVGVLRDVRQVQLHPLPPNDSEALLAEFAGTSRLMEDPAAASVLVQTCAGLPLAIRLIGARLQANPDLGVADLAADVAADPERLGDGGGHGPDLGGTLVGLIDDLAVSDNAGDHDAALAMHVVGLLPSPAASPNSIAVATGWTESRARRALERLAHNSLVSSPSPGAFRAHDLIHRFMADRAREESGDAAVREVRFRVLEAYRAVAWCSRGLTRASAEGLDEAALKSGPMSVTDPVECIDLLAADFEQVVALIRDVVTYDDEGAVVGAHTVLGLVSYFVARADSTSWRALLEGAVESLPAGCEDEEMHLRLDLAMFYGVRGQLAVASTHVDRVLDIARQRGRPRAEVAALSHRSSAWRRIGRLDYALEDVTVAVDRGREVGDTRMLAGALRDLGIVQASSGATELGLEAEREALRLYRLADASRGIAMALINVGVMLRDLGQMGEARAHLEEAVTQATVIRDRTLESEALDELGYWYVLAGDHRRGLRVLRDGLALVEDRGGRTGEASLRRRLGHALHGLGRLSEADEHWWTAVRIYEQAGDRAAAADLRHWLIDHRSHDERARLDPQEV
ncbi:XRE family transcriptional regulator [Demetria terragena]|uniref:XRE family transcriptional regulator n=1 Tax=Demetria terragena TaxID=63959 RepID=UPI0003795E93|nr:XRE family transcriptional regulator [Demetria terragena]